MNVLSANYRSQQVHRGVARIFQRGVTLCHTQGIYQIVLSTSTLCFTKSDIFSEAYEQ